MKESANDSSPNAVQRFKVVLLGEGCVGKTSLAMRYCENVFQEGHLSTLQASFLEKRLNIKGQRVLLAIWDTAGQERFHALGPIYYRDSDGALLVYDVADIESFHRVQRWVKELRKILGYKVVLQIVGNKIDLLHSNTATRRKTTFVPMEEVEMYAKQVGATHCLTSAKSGVGIEQAFFALTKAMIKERKSEAAEFSQKESHRTLVVDDSSQLSTSIPSSSCC
eukprot:Sdes_comp17527_c0_seq1m6771